MWFDALDPDASGMQAELDLPQPEVRTRGRGVTYIYKDVSIDQADDVAEYLGDRAMTLGSQYGLDPNERELFRVMGNTARKLRRAVDSQWVPLESAGLDWEPGTLLQGPGS